MFSVPTDCSFCMKFGSNASGQLHHIFDKIICENENFVVVPARGSLVEGYLLIITRTHFRSMAHLSNALLLELEQLILKVTEIVTKHFGSPVIFEHGLVCEDVGVGSCIDHAHLHLVPVVGDILSQLKLVYKLRSIKTLREIAAQVRANESYLYFETQKRDRFVITRSTIPSQYMRRLIATEIGLPDQWDWAVFDFEYNARATLEKLSDKCLTDMLPLVRIGD